MKCLQAPADARVVFIDGPVAVFIQEDSKDAILEAYQRVGRLVEVAAEQLRKPKEGFERLETDISGDAL